MKFKKIIKNTIIFATMMLVIGVYTAPVISKAGDDVWYGASFDFDGHEKYLPSQFKYTSSSVWMSCTDKDIDGSYYYARVNAVNVSDNPVDVSHGYEYYFDVNETHTMLNWVYEEHYLSLIHISEPTRRTPISYAVFCLKKKNQTRD